MPSPVLFKDFPVEGRVIAVPERTTRVEPVGTVYRLFCGREIIGVTVNTGFTCIRGVLLPEWVLEVLSVRSTWYLYGTACWIALEGPPPNVEEIRDDLRRLSPED